MSSAAGAPNGRAPLNLHWFLPTAGDSREVVGLRPDGLATARQIWTT